MKLGRDVSCHNELVNWRNTHRYESVMATIWLLLTISETDPCLWDRLMGPFSSSVVASGFRLVGKRHSEGEGHHQSSPPVERCDERKVTI